MSRESSYGRTIAFPSARQPTESAFLSLMLRLLSETEVLKQGSCVNNSTLASEARLEREPKYEEGNWMDG